MLMFLLAGPENCWLGGALPFVDLLKLSHPFHRQRFRKDGVKLRSDKVVEGRISSLIIGFHDVGAFGY